jgi:hypothetical protein
MVFEFHARGDEKRRELVSDEKSSLILGMLILAVLSAFVFIILAIGIARLHKWRRNSFFAFIFDGLNRANRLLIVGYYAHFFLIRLIIIFMLIVSPFGSSNGIWMALANLQIIFLTLNLRKIYPTLQNNVINVLTEILILIVICFCTSASIGSD